MNNAMGWSLGLCCGVPLLAALVLGGAAGYWSNPATFPCLTVISLLGGYVAVLHAPGRGRRVGARRLGSHPGAAG